MSQLALDRIAENKKTKSKILDLGNCGLTEIPKELFDCVWLEELNLGLPEDEEKKKVGKLNKFDHLPSDIRELSTLRDLRCNNAGLSDISFLKGLSKLDFLSLNNNEINDILFLNYVPNLKRLSLHNNQISDISFLDKFTKLTSLSLSNNQISDISVLGKLTQLTSLYLYENLISDISFLGNLTNLTFLIIGFNKISNIEPLRNLTNLTTCYLFNNRIEDISPLVPILQKGVKPLLSNNPITSPPIEVVVQGNEAILNYFKGNPAKITKPIRKVDISIQITNHCVSGFHIKNFRGIVETQVEDFHKQTQWVFLTGENGFGKTSVLQALAKGLTGEGEVNGDSNIGQKVVAYGSSRLRVSAGNTKEVVAKYSAIDSLLSNETPLLDIEERLLDWQRNYSKGFLELEKLFKTLLPRLGRIDVVFNEAIKTSEVRYYETDDENEYYGDGITFDQLAAGYKNIIAMVGDMVYRLSLNQDVKTFSQLEGIVLIDEIELHLHAKYQRIFIEKLSELFPKIQFIVSTHSPIPLLGVPANSVIINVMRTQELGIQAHLLDIDFSTLTPDTILSSPIFGFQDLVPKSKSPLKIMRSEKRFKDIALNDQFKENINEYLSEESQEELLKLINAK